MNIWIPVEERLPEPGTRCGVLFDGEHPVCAIYCPTVCDESTCRYGDWEVMTCYCCTLQKDKRVTHWIRLPDITI